MARSVSPDTRGPAAFSPVQPSFGSNYKMFSQSMNDLSVQARASAIVPFSSNPFAGNHVLSPTRRDFDDHETASIASVATASTARTRVPYADHSHHSRPSTSGSANPVISISSPALPASAPAPPASAPHQLHHLSTPSISSLAPSEPGVAKEGWLNRSDGDKRASSRGYQWKLQRAIIKDNYLHLYKPSPDVAFKFFDVAAAPSRPQMPEPAPVPRSPVPHAVSHVPGARHKDLVYDDDGQVVSGTLEAVCHEIVFGDDMALVSDLLVLVPMWTDIDLAFEMILEYASLEDVTPRLAYILEYIVDNMYSILLDPGIFDLLSTSMIDMISSNNEQTATILREGLSQFSAAASASQVQVNASYAHMLKNGLTAATFSHIDLKVLAAQLHMFHLKLFREWSPINDISLLYAMRYSFSRSNPIMSTTTSHPHFLCSVMVQHLFPAEPSRSRSQSQIANLLTRWIELGRILKSRGDMVGWLAIATVVCSQAVCRLKDVWALVSADVYDVIYRDWSMVMFDLDRRLIFGESSRRESSHILAPDNVGKVHSKLSVPYFGDISLHFFETLGAGDRPLIDVEASRAHLFHIRRSLDRWTNYVNDAANLDVPLELDAVIPAFQECFYSVYAAYTASGYMSLSAMLEISLAFEPPATGQYSPFYSSQPSPLASGSYVSLLFTDVLNSYKLFERKNVLEAGGLLHKKSSMSTLRSKASAEPIVPGPPLKAGDLNVLGAGPAARNIRRVRSFPPLKPTVQTTGYSDLDSTTRARLADLPNRHLLMRNVRDILNMGVKLYHVRDHLVLKSFVDDTSPGSRPPSVFIENPSKRMSGTSRRLSAQFHTAMPNLSGSQLNRLSADPVEVELARPPTISVVAKSGTVDRLIDLLVLDMEAFSSKVDAVDVVENDRNKSRAVEFTMNMEIYTATFFGTFRSFCPPTTLLDGLRRRFLGARAAAASKALAARAGTPDADFELFAELAEPGRTDSPVTPVRPDVADDELDWRLVAKIHIGILEAFNLWVAEYFADFVNEVSIRYYFLEFLQFADREASRWKERAEANIHLRSFAEIIDNLLRKLRKAFAKRSYRPVDVPPRPAAVDSARPLRFPTRALDSISRFCVTVDRTVAAIFKEVSLKDWLTVYEIFELQSADPSRLFSDRVSLGGPEEDVVIQDVFGFCATLHCLQSDDLMVSQFPKPVKKLYALHMNFVSWLAWHVSEPSISRVERIDRMATLLRALAICRKMMGSVDIFKHAPADDEAPSAVGTIPSFVETAIAAALVRPESRVYSVAWTLAAREVGMDNASIDRLEDITPAINFELSALASSPIIQQPLTICVGWLFERMFELVCYVPNMCVENSRLINFDKQRYIYNLLSNVMDLRSKHDETDGDESAQSLLLYDNTVRRLDRRTVRETAAKDYKHFASKGGAKVPHAAFHAHVVQEIEKLRRDQKQREALDRRYGRDQSRYSQLRMKPAGHAPAAPAPAPSQLHMEKRNSRSSRFGGLLRAVRPLSMAFFNGLNPPSPDRAVSPFDLPGVSGTDTRKPSVSINLATTTATVHPSTRAAGIFKLVLDDRSEYVLQATSESHMDDWLRLCGQIRRAAVARGALAGPGIQEELDPSSQRTKVFGMPIAVLCERENQPIPRVVTLLLDEIESRGLEEVGIYRVPGSLASVQALKDAFDTGKPIDMDDDRWFDINTVAGCFKLFLRELPETILTKELYRDFARIGGHGNEETQIRLLRRTVRRLPLVNYSLLRRLMEHLATIARHGELNKMHSVNLAIVFSMSFLLTGSDSLSMTSDLGAMQTLLKIMIANPERIFVGAYGDAASSDDESGESCSGADSATLEPDDGDAGEPAGGPGGLGGLAGGPAAADGPPAEPAASIRAVPSSTDVSVAGDVASADAAPADATDEDTQDAAAAAELDALSLDVSRMELVNAATVAASADGLAPSAPGASTSRANKRASMLILLGGPGPSPPASTGSAHSSYVHDQDTDSKRNSIPEVRVF
ncbi:uncharacterized protein V1510DRAFT_437042 [Dipodascopsis tothii]|uniref:uncharacterized protein n=1 Tax=Dipodascopsis tothii TaxID=44089 RepID=UPI0034CF0E45